MFETTLFILALSILVVAVGGVALASVAMSNAMKIMCKEEMKEQKDYNEGIKL